MFPYIRKNELTVLSIICVALLISYFIISAILLTPKRPTREKSDLKTAIVYLGDTLGEGIRVDSIKTVRIYGKVVISFGKDSSNFIATLGPNGCIVFNLPGHKKLTLRNEIVESKE